MGTYLEAQSNSGTTIEAVEARFGLPARVVSDSLLAQGYSYELLANCGCSACDDGVQQGHFACSESPPELLRAEAVGLVVRSYMDGRWQWLVV